MPCAICSSITEATSITPRTSPSFQSFFGEFGSELWQFTQDCADMVSATAVRTTYLPLILTSRENVSFGLATRNSQACVWNSSSLRSLRPANGYLLYMPIDVSLSASIVLRSSISVAGNGIVPGTPL